MTADVVLRAAQDGDEDVLYHCLADLEGWELRSASVPRPVTRERFREKQAERAADDAVATFVIEAAGAPVGRCGLFGSDRLAHHAEVGISLIAEAQGKGYGTAALQQMIEFGFQRWNLHRLHLGVLASNVAARAVYRKLGFVEEGVLREHAWVNGRWDDEVLMGLLRSDWCASGS